MNMQSLSEAIREMEQKLGPEFKQALDALDTADVALGEFYRRCNTREDSLTFLRCITSLYAMKASSYAGSGVLDHQLDPSLAFETIQNRVLYGLDMVLKLHAEKCTAKGDCAGSKTLGDFLLQMLTAMRSVHERADAAKKPETVH